VVDRAGHVHALARQIDSFRTRDVKSRLAALPPASLPTVDQVSTEADFAGRVDASIHRQLQQ
jgi:hypothetical protein